MTWLQRMLTYKQELIEQLKTTENNEEILEDLSDICWLLGHVNYWACPF